MHIETPTQNKPQRPPVMVAAEDADLVKKIHRALKSGKNAEVRLDKSGATKVFRVSREIEK